MPLKAMILPSDSHNPAASDMPFYAVSKNGQFEIIDTHDIVDLPCYTLTPAGREEVLDNDHTHEWLNDALAKRGIDTAWMDAL